jgi:hypothetical protein
MAVEQLKGAATTRALLTIAEAPSYGYGQQPVGAMVNKAFTVKNVGAATATALAMQPPNDPFSVAGTTCGSMLAVNATCTVTVAFTPDAAGSAADTLKVAYDDGGGLKTASCDVGGTGVPPALLTLSDGPTYDFGQVAVSSQAPHMFVLQNTGGWPATGVTGMALASPYDYRGAVGYPGFGASCGPVLEPGAACSIALTFTPTAATTVPGTLTVSYSDGAMQTSVMRALTGAGTQHAALIITDWPVLYYNQYGLPTDATTFSFGKVGVGQTIGHTFYVTNVGGGDASQLQGSALATGPVLSYAGGGAAPGQGGSCGATLAAGASCTIVATFSPTNTMMTNSSVVLSYNDGSAVQMATRPLTGTGTNAALLEVDDFPGLRLGFAVDFGTLGLGNSTDRQVFLVNNGGATATQISGTFGGGQGFTFKGGNYPGAQGTCGPTLASGSSCMVTLSFSPTGPGVANDTFTVSYGDGTGMATATRSLLGTGTQAALLRIAVSSINGGGPQLPSFD